MSSGSTEAGSRYRFMALPFKLSKCDDLGALGAGKGKVGGSKERSGRTRHRVIPRGTLKI